MMPQTEALGLSWSLLDGSSIQWKTAPLGFVLNETKSVEKFPVIIRGTVRSLRPEWVKDMFMVLTGEERRRAERFRQEIDYTTFVYTRWLLRTVLGRVLNADAGSLCIEADAHGKPQLTASPDKIEFNVSHSHGEVALIVSSGMPVGIDVERLDSKCDVLGLAQRFFHHQETEDLLSVPETERTKAFVHIWTAKEAVVKAVGRGLSISLDSFHIPLNPLLKGHGIDVRIAGDLIRVFPMPGDGKHAGAVALCLNQ